MKQTNLSCYLLKVTYYKDTFLKLTLKLDQIWIYFHYMAYKTKEQQQNPPKLNKTTKNTPQTPKKQQHKNKTNPLALHLFAFNWFEHITVLFLE